MDFSLSAEAGEFRSRFSAWVDSALPVDWRDVPVGSVSEDALAEVRRSWGRLLSQFGWAAPNWPRDYGGLGLTVDEQVAYLSVLVDFGAPEPLNSNPIGVLGPCLMRFGTLPQRARYLTPMLSHQEIWCQGFSEPGAGSDLGAVATTAQRVADGYRLSGQKVWTSYAQFADYCYILARTDNGSSKRDGLSMFLMDMRQPGVTVRPLRTIAGSAEFNEVFLDDAVVTADAIVGGEGNGWKVAMYALAEERTTGIAQRALRLRRDYRTLTKMISRERKAGNSLASSDTVLDEVVSLGLATRTVEAIVYRNLALIAQGQELGAFSPMVILTWSQAHQRIRELVVRLLGEQVLSDADEDGSWLSSLLFSRGASIAGGTSEIQRNAIAKDLGLPSGRS